MFYNFFGLSITWLKRSKLKVIGPSGILEKKFIGLICAMKVIYLEE